MNKLRNRLMAGLAAVLSIGSAGVNTVKPVSAVSPDKLVSQLTGNLKGKALVDLEFWEVDNLWDISDDARSNLLNSITEKDKNKALEIYEFLRCKCYCLGNNLICLLNGDIVTYADLANLVNAPQRSEYDVPLVLFTDSSHSSYMLVQFKATKDDLGLRRVKFEPHPLSWKHNRDNARITTDNKVVEGKSVILKEKINNKTFGLKRVGEPDLEPNKNENKKLSELMKKSIDSMLEQYVAAQKKQAQKQAQEKINKETESETLKGKNRQSNRRSGPMRKVLGVGVPVTIVSAGTVYGVHKWRSKSAPKPVKKVKNDQSKSF